VGGIGGGGIGVDAHVGQVAAHALLEEGAGGDIERLAGAEAGFEGFSALGWMAGLVVATGRGGVLRATLDRAFAGLLAGGGAGCCLLIGHAHDLVGHGIGFALDGIARLAHGQLGAHRQAIECVLGVGLGW